METVHFSRQSALLEHGTSLSDISPQKPVKTGSGGADVGEYSYAFPGRGGLFSATPYIDPHTYLALPCHAQPSKPCAAGVIDRPATALKLLIDTESTQKARKSLRPSLSALISY